MMLECLCASRGDLETPVGLMVTGSMLKTMDYITHVDDEVL